MDSTFFGCRRLTVGYHKTPLIKNINFELYRGEIMTLIGPNGAGKSTILKTIARQLERLDGTIFLGKDDWKEISAKSLSEKLSVVFTERLHTEMMTCEDIVAMGRYPYTGHFGIMTAKDCQAVEDALQMVHIENLRNHSFEEISDGQRQRVLLARALCQEPEVLLLDEPTSFLDMKHKVEFLSVLQKLTREKQLTVIMSLHELDLAERISDKILCVKGDSIQKWGTPQEIFKKDYMRTLFDMTVGSFDEKSGDIELEAPQGDPGVFVLAGNGSGREIYRRLQRQGISFTTGILFQNDMDYPVARALAAKVIDIPAFQKISEKEIEYAKTCILSSDRLFCCVENWGMFEHIRIQLLDFAAKNNVEISLL